MFLWIEARPGITNKCPHLGCVHIAPNDREWRTYEWNRSTKFKALLNEDFVNCLISINQKKSWKNNLAYCEIDYYFRCILYSYNASKIEKIHSCIWARLEQVYVVVNFLIHSRTLTPILSGKCEKKRRIKYVRRHFLFVRHCISVRRNILRMFGDGHCNEPFFGFWGPITYFIYTRHL